MITTSSIGRRGLLQASWIILMATVGISQPRDISRKVDPALQQAQAKIGADISMRHSSLEHYAAGVRLPQQEGESVGILVQGGPETRTQIERVGGRIGSQHGDVVTAIVPLRAVEDLARESVVEYIEASRILYDDVNQSVPKTGADILHAQIDPSMRLTGRGVILGFTDSGIDIYHPNFKTATGRTRILYVWDQYAAGTPPAGFIYGAEFDSSRINQGTLLLTPGFHGTHVAGIAAGGGLPTKTYVGMAPEADIIMVVNSGSDLFNRGQTTVGTLDGYDFIRTKAAQLRKRFVINTSQGTNMGPHDGTTLF